MFASKRFVLASGAVVGLLFAAGAQAAVVTSDNASSIGKNVSAAATSSTPPSAVSILNATSASSVAISKQEAKAAKAAAKAAKKAAKAQQKALKKAAKAAKKAQKAAAKAAKKAAKAAKKNGTLTTAIVAPSFSNGIAAFPPSEAPSDATTPTTSSIELASQTLTNPVPAGLPLLLTGLAALCGLMRKRAKAA